MFCVGGLYGKNLSFKIGTKRDNCELPAANSYSNVICDDNKSMAILVSDHCTALITRYINLMVYLEREGEIQVPPSYSGTLNTGEKLGEGGGIKKKVH